MSSKPTSEPTRCLHIYVSDVIRLSDLIRCLAASGGRFVTTTGKMPSRHLPDAKLFC